MGGVLFGIAGELGHELRWGKDWDRDMDFKDQKFDDMPHFEVLDR